LNPLVLHQYFEKSRLDGSFPQAIGKRTGEAGGTIDLLNGLTLEFDAIQFQRLATCAQIPGTSISDKILNFPLQWEFFYRHLDSVMRQDMLLTITGSRAKELGASIDLFIGIKVKFSGPAFQDFLCRSIMDYTGIIVSIN
jgi:hypothetical protein